MDYNKYRNTRTERNLKRAFIGEAAAANKYKMFASRAKDAGFGELADYYEMASNNEYEHSSIWYKELHDIDDFVENLKSTIDGELYETLDMYMQMAKEAEEEGFYEIAAKFRMVASIERQHAYHFKKFLSNIDERKTFKDTATTLWRCSNCGFIYEGSSAPEQCPCCEHDRLFFSRYEPIDSEERDLYEEK